LSKKRSLKKIIFENPVPLNMRLQLQSTSVTVGKMAGIFTKRIWQPYMGRQTCFFPWAPSNLVTLLLTYKCC